MEYRIQYRKQALLDAARLQKEDATAFKKFKKIIEELKAHPRTGTGKPEYLSRDLSKLWSRRLSQKHRLVYEIIDKEVVVVVITAYGHYGDK